MGKYETYVDFDPEVESTWPLANLRVLIIQKPTVAFPMGFHLYAKRKSGNRYWALLHKGYIPLESIAFWRYAPEPEQKKFVPKRYV